MEEREQGRDADIGDMFRDAEPPARPLGRPAPQPSSASNGLRKATITPPLFSRPSPAPNPQAPADPAAGAAPPPARKAPPRQKTVLVVDDNKDYRELVRHLLEVNRYKVLEAGNGIEALALIQASAPDLMLVDFNMPKMNGYELIQEVRSNVDTHGIKIIMFTGATNRQQLRALNLDITEFLEKPVPNMKLLESVAGALGPRTPPAPREAPRPAERRPDPAPRAIEPEPPSITIERFDQEAPAPAQARDYAAPPAPAEEQRRPAAIELPREPEPPPGPQERPVAEPPAEQVPEIEEVLAENDGELEVLDSAAEKKEEAMETIGLESLAKDSPLIQRVNKILAAAVDMRASDIHIEPQEARVVVRARVDGVLKQLTTLPISIHPRLTARIKIMSNLVITERRIPQDGQFRVQMRDL